VVAAAPTWTEIARGIAAVVQVLAIVVAGSWAYYKFVRGRTFKPRAEIDVDAGLLEADGDKAISLTVGFRNAGLIYIEFPPGMNATRLVRVWGTDATSAGTNPYWGDELILVDLFEGHDGCEVGETLTDHVLLPVPTACGSEQRPWRAFRIEVMIVSPKRVGPTGRPRPWRATAILADALSDRATSNRKIEGRTDETVAAR
jgi:hypothetical protein